MSEAHALPRIERQRLLVRGLVQGVGFRPTVFRIAESMGFSGFVRNDGDGVTLEIEGENPCAFIDALRAALPPLARIDDIIATAVPVTGDQCFSIRESAVSSSPASAIPADVAMCEDCLRELFDPGDRRYLHPFIACCNCGPRYSITLELPYDRRNTTMANFPMCTSCESEYMHPSNRRFHAEPIACHDCGPALSHDLGLVADTIAGGGIVALKGVGGYHLVCDARNHDAVRQLRRRKQRDGKPLAVMTLNAASASQWVTMTAEAKTHMIDPLRPIMVLPVKPAASALSPEIAPGTGTIGVMLPYTAAHYLLFYHLLGQPTGQTWLAAEQAPVLVMTSANLGGDPLIADDDEALTRLSSIADLIVSHDRVIARRVDDSVSLGQTNPPSMVRRARGHVPGAVRLPGDGPAALGVGACLKNTMTLARGDLAYPSPHVGDLSTPATRGYMEECVQHLMDTLKVKPEVIACDLHPDYPSSRLAETLAMNLGVPLVRFQHHHAHAAAVVAELGLREPVLALALDGHGMGCDGGSWGGELLALEGTRFERWGHLAPIPMPGGDKAAREPWRMAAGILHLLGRTGEIGARYPDEPLAPALGQLLQSGTCPTTTATGRLFDAAAGLLGVCHRATFEADAPMRLQALVESPAELAGGFRIIDANLDLTPLMAHLACEGDAGRGAEVFHGTLISALTTWISDAARSTGMREVVLSGGCFLNPWLATLLPLRLSERGIKAFLPGQMPPNDGGLSLGQAYLAREQLMTGSTTAPEE